MLKDLAKQLHDYVYGSFAEGLNDAADTVLKDIKDHVQVRTGALRDSYGVTERATPNKLKAKVSSPLAEAGKYGERHYPNDTSWIPEDRRRSVGGLFEKGDEKVLTELVEEKVTKALRRRRK